MKKLVLVPMILAISLFANAQNLVFVTQDKPDFPNILGEGSAFPAEKPGATVELIRLLEKQLGLKIEIRRYPWARCLEVELKTGAADGAFIASYKAEREAMGAYPTKGTAVDPSKRVATLTYSFFRKAGTDWTWDGKTLPALDGKVGVPGGYSIAADLEALGAGVIANGSTDTNMKNLLAGRVALVATIDEDGEYLLTKPEYAGKIEKVAVPIVSKPYYLMLSRQFVAKNPALAEKIWTTLADLRTKNYATLVAKYF